MMKHDVAAAALPDDGLDPEIRQFVRLMSQRWRQHPPLDRVPLRLAGVRSHVAIYAGATHSFLEAVSIARISDRAFAEASRWLSDMLRTDAPAERAR